MIVCPHKRSAQDIVLKLNLQYTQSLTQYSYMYVSAFTNMIFNTLHYLIDLHCLPFTSMVHSVTI